MKRITKIPSNSIIGGVCAGFGKYFNIDPTWIRVIWLLSIFGAGIGIGLYIVFWIILPDGDCEEEPID